MTQRQEVHGPPAYFTPNSSRQPNRVPALAALAPSVLVSGHGIPMSGRPLHDALFRLADCFERDEVPARGRTSAARRSATTAAQYGCRQTHSRDNLARVAVPVALGQRRWSPSGAAAPQGSGMCWQDHPSPEVPGED